MDHQKRIPQDSLEETAGNNIVTEVLQYIEKRNTDDLKPSESEGEGEQMRKVFINGEPTLIYLPKERRGKAESNTSNENHCINLSLGLYKKQSKVYLKAIEALGQSEEESEKIGFSNNQICIKAKEFLKHGFPMAIASGTRTANNFRHALVLGVVDKRPCAVTGRKVNHYAIIDGYSSEGLTKKETKSEAHTVILEHDKVRSLRTPKTHESPGSQNTLFDGNLNPRKETANDR